MSSTRIAVYQLNQEALTPLTFDSLALTDVAEQRPGVYTITRTYQGDRVLRFDLHIKRLEESANLLGIPLALDRAWLRDALRRCVEQLNYPETRFCISVPRGEPTTLYLAFEPLNPLPDAVWRDGVSVHTIRAQRHKPHAKSTEWIALRREMRQALPPDAYEGLLIGPDNLILEGMSSNFFAVLNGELRTAGEGVLNGTARAVLLEVAPAVLPVRLQPVTLDDAPRLDEALLTSSSRGVIPVTRINGAPVHDGRPGPIAAALRARYDAWAEAHLEPL